MKKNMMAMLVAVLVLLGGIPAACGEEAGAFEKVYGGEGTDNLFGAIALDDGGFLLYGDSEPTEREDGRASATPYEDAWAVAVDAAGVVQWEYRTADEEKYEQFESAVQLPGGSIVLLYHGYAQEHLMQAIHLTRSGGLLGKVTLPPQTNSAQLLDGKIYALHQEVLREGLADEEYRTTVICLELDMEGNQVFTDTYPFMLTDGAQGRRLFWHARWPEASTNQTDVIEMDGLGKVVDHWTIDGEPAYGSFIWLQDGEYGCLMHTREGGRRKTWLYARDAQGEPLRLPVDVQGNELSYGDIVPWAEGYLVLGSYQSEPPQDGYEGFLRHYSSDWQTVWEIPVHSWAGHLLIGADDLPYIARIQPGSEEGGNKFLLERVQTPAPEGTQTDTASGQELVFPFAIGEFDRILIERLSLTNTPGALVMEVIFVPEPADGEAATTNTTVYLMQDEAGETPCQPLSILYETTTLPRADGTSVTACRQTSEWPPWQTQPEAITVRPFYLTSGEWDEAVVLPLAFAQGD